MGVEHSRRPLFVAKPSQAKPSQAKARDLSIASDTLSRFSGQQTKDQKVAAFETNPDKLQKRHFPEVDSQFRCTPTFGMVPVG